MAPPTNGPVTNLPSRREQRIEKSDDRKILCWMLLVVQEHAEQGAENETLPTNEVKKPVAAKADNETETEKRNEEPDKLSQRKEFVCRVHSRVTLVRPNLRIRFFEGRRYMPIPGGDGMAKTSDLLLWDIRRNLQGAADESVVEPKE